MTSANVRVMPSPYVAPMKIVAATRSLVSLVRIEVEKGCRFSEVEDVDAGDLRASFVGAVVGGNENGAEVGLGTERWCVGR